MDKQLEERLFKAGAVDKDGYILRPKVREAWDRIWQGVVPMRVSGTQANNLADNFLKMLVRYAEDHELTFDEGCEKLGY